MSKKEVRQAAAELTERLCEKDFLDRSGPVSYTHLTLPTN